MPHKNMMDHKGKPHGDQAGGIIFENKEIPRDMDRKIRVLIAKPGLDGHDRGAKVIARALRDAGMEVIYTGLRQTPEMIANAALQEDVDAVGLSILSGAHMTLVPRVIELMKANGQDALVFVGGIIPEEDAELLETDGCQGSLRTGHPHDQGDRRPQVRCTGRNSALMELAKEAAGGSRLALSRLLTLVENQDEAGLSALDALYPKTGNAHIIGITGPPGPGKSTLVNRLAVDLADAELNETRHYCCGPNQPFQRRGACWATGCACAIWRSGRIYSSARWPRGVHWAGWPGQPAKPRWRWTPPATRRS